MAPHSSLKPTPLCSFSPQLAPDLEQARPATSGEEELQLQLALAMSREESEKVQKRTTHSLFQWAQTFHAYRHMRQTERGFFALLLTFYAVVKH